MATAKKTPSGNWRVQIFLGRDKDGTKRKKSITAPTKREAERLAAEYIMEMENEAEELTKTTVRQAVRGYIDIKKNVLSPATIRGYEIILDNRLQSVMPLDIHDLDSIAMQKAINEDASKLSPKSIREAKNLIVTALKMYGVKPDLNVTLPAKEPKMKDLPTAAQVIQMIRGTDIELPCLLAIWLSLRMSEVRGLQFGDLKDGILTIRRSKLYIGGKDVIRNVNKTYNSTRRLVVPEYIEALINSIPHQSDDDFIVAKSYQVIKKHLKKLTDANGYSLTFHDLRHLNASVMLMLGVPDKYAMERGGWSTPNTLKAVYQHTFSEERKRVDNQINGFFDSLLRV